MDWAHFVTLSRTAPQIVDWLTDLGTDLREKFRGLEDENDTSVGAPNFELTSIGVAPFGAVLSDKLMRAAFSRHSGGGGDNSVMDKAEFCECVRSELRLSNRHVANLLFRIFDSADNGTITRVEFCERWRTLAGDDAMAKREVCFKLCDVKQQDFLDKMSLRLFFFSFFD